MYGAKNVLVKLSDYGISQFVATQGARGLVGTPGFMAPEMLKYQGKEVYCMYIITLNGSLHPLHYAENAKSFT